jgi:hypothetical protein
MYDRRSPEPPGLAPTDVCRPTALRDDETGEDLGILDHPAPNVEVGDLVLLADGREVVVTARVEGWRGSSITADLDVAVSPFEPGATAFHHD